MCTPWGQQCAGNSASISEKQFPRQISNINGKRLQNLLYAFLGSGNSVLPSSSVYPKANHHWQYANYPNLLFFKVESCVCLAV